MSTTLRLVIIRMLVGWVAVGLLPRDACAQMDTAILAGRVADASDASIAGARVELTDTDRNVKTFTRTTVKGLYLFPSVTPGHYQVVIFAPGFKTVTISGLILNTQESRDENVRMTVGSPLESVILEANSTPVQTTGAVGSLIERELVGELPLNGRSFQTLFQLVPGAVIAPTSFASQGQFSVNGQRTDANYFVVDGVSANFGIAAGVSPGQSAGGWLPALTVLGGTNALVSTEAVQEFAMLTSSYSAEFGRVPGGQVSIVTKSGTNRLSGRLFEYLRNDALDANDWFANHEGLPRAALRQNDFGGVLGGPIVPDKTFFFASFEGLQLQQPTSNVSEVPSLEARISASAAVQPFLNAYPLPNGPDQGNGLAQATYGLSDPSSLEAFSIRVDNHFQHNFSAFVRYAYSLSDGQQRAPGTDAASTVVDTRFGLETLTLGLQYSISPRLINDTRFNWSKSSASSNNVMDDFGGAIPVPQQLMFPPGFTLQNSEFEFAAGAEQQVPVIAAGRNVSNQQPQINIVDDLSYQTHGHLLKAGIDFRQLLPKVIPAVYEEASFFPGIQSAVLNQGLFADTASSVPVQGTFRNYAAFCEDTWSPSSSLSLTVGLRWDFVGPPSIIGANGLRPFGVSGFRNLSSLALSPAGSPLYRTSKTNIAPRLGFAHEIGESPKAQSLVRGGVGIFYDLSNGATGNALSSISFPYTATTPLPGISLPLTSAAAAPPSITINPPFGIIQAFPSAMRTPYSYEWNLSFDQAIGLSQTATLSYVGSSGHQLLRTEEYIGGVDGVPSQFEHILLTGNTGYSNLEALQFKFHRRTGPIHVIATYVWSHSLDDVSSDIDFNAVPGRFISPRLDYGSSDFDIRNVATLGADYALPQLRKGKVLRGIASGWFLDSIVFCRSSPPVDPFFEEDAGLGVYDFRPNLVPGEPLYILSSDLPGGRAINPAALSLPAVGTQGDLGRNSFRGYALFQMDLAVRRRFLAEERITLDVDVEAFNLFNHSNFAPPVPQMGTVLPTGEFAPQGGFGVSPSTLDQGLQGGSFGSGFSPLYQIGGARSLQLALKLNF